MSSQGVVWNGCWPLNSHLSYFAIPSPWILPCRQALRLQQGILRDLLENTLQSFFHVLWFIPLSFAVTLSPHCSPFLSPHAAFCIILLFSYIYPLQYWQYCFLGRAVTQDIGRCAFEFNTLGFKLMCLWLTLQCNNTGLGYPSNMMLNPSRSHHFLVAPLIEL